MPYRNEAKANVLPSRSGTGTSSNGARLYKGVIRALIS